MNHFVNKFRKETEYHDMAQSFMDFCSPGYDLIDSFFSQEKMKDIFFKFAETQEENNKKLIDRIQSSGTQMSQHYMHYSHEIENIPNDVTKFLAQIEDLWDSMKKTQSIQEYSKKVSLKEKKAKAALEKARETGESSSKLQKLEEDYNKVKQEFTQIKQHALKERQAYIEKSDKYSTEFPCQLSNIIIDLCIKRKQYLEAIIPVAEQLCQISADVNKLEPLPDPETIDPLEFDSSNLIIP